MIRALRSRLREAHGAATACSRSVPGSVLMISIAIAAAAAAWRRATSSGGRPMSASIMAAPSRTAAAIRGAKSPEVGIGREHAVCELAKFAVFGFGLAGEQPTAVQQHHVRPAV